MLSSINLPVFVFPFYTSLSFSENKKTALRQPMYRNDRSKSKSMPSTHNHCFKTNNNIRKCRICRTSRRYNPKLSTLVSLSEWMDIRASGMNHPSHCSSPDSCPAAFTVAVDSRGFSPRFR